MKTTPAFTPKELQRYQRQLLLPEIGYEGQQHLKNARVLIVGLGGLGSPLALYLTAAGVGTLGLIEADRIELSNLHRQILYRQADVGDTKINVAARELRALNSELNLDLYREKITAQNAEAILADYDIAIDASDNFSTRYLLNDLCVLRAKPLVYGSVSKFQGLLSVVLPGMGPCYRCLHPYPPPQELAPDCNQGGILGILPGTIAMLQATETLKLITGIGESLSGRVIRYDGLTMCFREIELPRDPNCAVCGTHPRITAIIDENYLDSSEMCSTIVSATISATISAPELKERGIEWALLLDVREIFERETCKIEPSDHIPLAELMSRLDKIPKTRPVVVYCKSGQRSAKACETLRAKGFSEVWNLRGGIDAYMALDNHA